MRDQRYAGAKGTKTGQHSYNPWKRRRRRRYFPIFYNTSTFLPIKFLS